MSTLVRCPVCGKMREVPSYPGDGTYDNHPCPPSY